MRGAATEKARLPTVESLTEGDWCRQNAVSAGLVDRRLEPVDPGIAGRFHVILYMSVCRYKAGRSLKRITMIGTATQSVRHDDATTSYTSRGMPPTK